MTRHFIPYAGNAAGCPCPLQPCGGLVQDVDCPDHGDRRIPTVEWHPAGGELCRRLADES